MNIQPPKARRSPSFLRRGASSVQSDAFQPATSRLFQRRMCAYGGEGRQKIKVPVFPLSALYPPVPLLAQTCPPLTPLWDQGSCEAKKPPHHPSLPRSPRQLGKPQGQQLGARDDASSSRLEVQQRASARLPNRWPDGEDFYLFRSHKVWRYPRLNPRAHKSSSISSRDARCCHEVFIW